MDTTVPRTRQQYQCIYSSGTERLWMTMLNYVSLPFTWSVPWRGGEGSFNPPQNEKRERRRVSPARSCAQSICDTNPLSCDHAPAGFHFNTIVDTTNTTRVNVEGGRLGTVPEEIVGTPRRRSPSVDQRYLCQRVTSSLRRRPTGGPRRAPGLLQGLSLRRHGQSVTASASFAIARTDMGYLPVYGSMLPAPAKGTADVRAVPEQGIPADLVVQRITGRPGASSLRAS